MSDSFAMLFSSLLDSTVWVGQKHHVPKVWIALLLMKDERGMVHAPLPGLANRAQVTIAEAEEALAVLLAPDPYSRNDDNGGRRLEAIRGGWLVLNHETFRSRQRQEQERDRKREDARRRREPLQTATDRYAPLPSGPEPLPDAESRDVSVSSSGSESSDPESEGVQGEPPGLVIPIRRSARFAPADFTPTDWQRVRCQELRFDVDALVRDFKNHEFNREYTDWPRRFSKWIEDEKLKRQAGLAAVPGLRGPSPPSRPGDDLDTTGAAMAWRPNSDHEAFAREHLPRADLSDLASRCRAVPRFAKLGTVQQDREFLSRLRYLKATGTWKADGPLKLPQPKGASP